MCHFSWMAGEPSCQGKRFLEPLKYHPSPSFLAEGAMTGTQRLRFQASVPPHESTETGLPPPWSQAVARPSLSPPRPAALLVPLRPQTHTFIFKNQACLPENNLP